MRYEDLIFGIQALRRQAELQQCPVLGAAGIRAFCYPHQLYVVREVLSHTKIRHLLADEVGLGKTIEALMIMNALRIRNGGKLRVSIVVGGEERAKQWRGEICGRFPYPFWRDDVHENGIWRDNEKQILFKNNNVFFDVTSEETVKNHLDLPEFPDDGVKFIWTQNSDDNKKYLEADKMDLLILDEIHRFSDTLLNFLSSRSADYPNVLVLSATPLLSREKERMQLLKLLDPEEAEWAELCGRTVEFRNVPIMRSRRLDFPISLPQREPSLRPPIEPLENDIIRIRKSGELLRDMLRNNVIEEENAALFARRATVGGQTLIDRIDDYRNTNRYPEYIQYAERLTELRTLCTVEQGDARFDELIDYLLEFFTKDESKKVIIAAQDNPTIDYLAKHINRCLPEKKILQLRQERRSRDLTETEERQLSKPKTNRSIIEQFWHDKHQILIAHNDARESYNLQIADALVFYSLPWKPIDMEQWLGRISRLGLRKPKTVEIVALVLRDSMDEKVADIYRSLNMFTHPLDLEKNRSILQEIEMAIRNAVFYGGDTNLRHFVKQLRNEDEVEEWDLFHITPDDAARKIDKQIQDEVVQPVIQRQTTQQKGKRVFPKEDALDAWISLLKKQKILFNKSYKDCNYSEHQHPEYYRFEAMEKHREYHTTIPFLEEEPIGAKPFLLKRSKIQIPPRDLVPLFVSWDYRHEMGYISDIKQDNNERFELPIHFFNFGSQLHDNFINHFAKNFRQPKLYRFSISLKSGTDSSEELPIGDYLIGICTTQRKQIPHPNLLAGLPKSENDTQERMRQTEQRRLETGLSADDRFLDLWFPGSLEIVGFYKNINEWVRVKPERYYKFLTQVPKVKEAVSPQNIPEEKRNFFTRLAGEATQRRWTEDLTDTLAGRIEILQQELQSRETNLQFNISETQRKIDAETNRDIIVRNYLPTKKRLEEQLHLVHHHFKIRQKYLVDCFEAKKQVECCCKAVLYLRLQN